jgi:hypothetical protein
MVRYRDCGRNRTGPGLFLLLTVFAGQWQGRERFAGAMLACSRSMESWLGPVVFVVLWLVLQTWVLPRLGVPT